MQCSVTVLYVLISEGIYIKMYTVAKLWLCIRTRNARGFLLVHCTSLIKKICFSMLTTTSSNILVSIGRRVVSSTPLLHDDARFS